MWRYASWIAQPTCAISCCRRPDNTEGLSEDELAALVTRDSMIGVTQAKQPNPAALAR